MWEIATGARLRAARASAVVIVGARIEQGRAVSFEPWAHYVLLKFFFFFQKLAPLIMKIWHSTINSYFYALFATILFIATNKSEKSTTPKPSSTIIVLNFV